MDTGGGRVHRAPHVGDCVRGKMQSVPEIEGNGRVAPRALVGGMKGGKESLGSTMSQAF